MAVSHELISRSLKSGSSNSEMVMRVRFPRGFKKKVVLCVLCAEKTMIKVGRFGGIRVMPCKVTEMSVEWQKIGEV